MIRKFNFDIVLFVQLTQSRSTSSSLLSSSSSTSPSSSSSQQLFLIVESGFGHFSPEKSWTRPTSCATQSRFTTREGVSGLSLVSNGPQFYLQVLGQGVRVGGISDMIIPFKKTSFDSASVLVEFRCSNLRLASSLNRYRPLWLIL